MIDLNKVADGIDQTYGINISVYDAAFLTKSVEERMRATHTDSTISYCGYLKNNSKEAKILLESLNIHYSIFFRDPLAFAILERSILPGLIQNRDCEKQKEIRVWSAGCAAGQVAYSIAMLLEEQICSNHQKVKYRIFATDWDEAILTEARAGVYPPSALGNVSHKRVSTWFNKGKDHYIIKPALRQHIDFSVFDLLGEEQTSPPSSIFGNFDLVFCSNVLIYYKPDFQSQILEKLSHSLSKGGYLFTDDAEQASVLAHNFQAVFPPAAIFQAKL